MSNISKMHLALFTLFFSSLAFAQSESTTDKVGAEANPFDKFDSEGPWKEFERNENPEFSDWLPIVTSTSYATYYMRPEDVIDVRTSTPKVWIKVDHSKDKTVPYRRAIMLLRFDCANESLTVLSHTTYMPNGTVHSSTRGAAFEYIAPETIAESWARNACPKES